MKSGLMLLLAVVACGILFRLFGRWVEDHQYDPKTGDFRFCPNSKKRCNADNCKCWDIEQERRRADLERQRT